MTKQSVTEKDKNVIEQWFEDAKKQTLDTLPVFLKHLTEDYDHDYGTICKAMAAAMIATGRSVDNSPTGGITGFQASCIMWDFISKWMHWENQPMKLVKYEDMLYPQYENKFDKTISMDTAKWLQDQAREKLNNKSSQGVHPEVEQHWKNILNGIIPFGYKVKLEK